METDAPAPTDRRWAAARDELHARGMRWTPQRRLLIEVLSRTTGHITGAEIVERCKALDPSTIPSTVYRTLDVLEELGLVRHAHGADGREEYHVLPRTEHGHLHCSRCGRSWDVESDEAAQLMAALRRDRGFEMDLSHLTISGHCADCRGARVS
ncbi:MAG: Fur family transcriptional regulator [Chloroflexota bacterium]|mgnify:CR=1 FL=1